MKDERFNQQESKYRGMEIKETRELFKKLCAGDPSVAAYCLRIRTPKERWAKNSAMRDPVIYRMNADTPHHRTGTKYKAYPTYDWACPIVDSHEGVTHAMRTTEYRLRDDLYHWLQDTVLKVRHVYIQEFGRLNFTYTVMSKRKLRKLVDMGEVDSWIDPRFPTVQGILRRGIQLPVLKAFILKQGFSEKVVNMEWDKFWGDNARYLDKICGRYMAVSKDNNVKIHLKGLGEDIGQLETPLHPKDPTLGKKMLPLFKRVLVERSDADRMKAGTRVTLMRWGNIVVDSVEKDADNRITAIHASPDFDNKDFKKTIKVTWLADVPGLVEVQKVEFDHLITKKKIEPDDVLEEILTSKIHPTKAVTTMLVDPSIVQVKPNSCCQLERVGYFRCDQASNGTDPMVLFQIPDGKQKAMSSLSSKLAHR